VGLLLGGRLLSSPTDLLLTPSDGISLLRLVFSESASSDPSSSEVKDVDDFEPLEYSKSGGELGALSSMADFSSTSYTVAIISSTGDAREV
jgi:hypothetical protein